MCVLQFGRPALKFDRLTVTPSVWGVYMPSEIPNRTEIYDHLCLSLTDTPLAFVGGVWNATLRKGLDSIYCCTWLNLVPAGELGTGRQFSLMS